MELDGGCHLHSFEFGRIIDPDLIIQIVEIIIMFLTNACLIALISAASLTLRAVARCSSWGHLLYINYANCPNVRID